MRKTAFIFAAALLFIFILGCSPSTDEPAPTATPLEHNIPDPLYVSGVYTASAQGYAGSLEVEVTFNEYSIMGIEVMANPDTDAGAVIAVDRLLNRIVKKQTLNVDAISGATATSEAFIAAVEDCVEQAGGDVEKLREVE